MFNYLFQDFKSRNMSASQTFIRLFFDRGVSAVFMYRLSNWFYHHKLTFISVILKQINIFINHCDIDYKSEIGKGLRIYHAIGIVIADCNIGENFSICQNSTIGKSGKPDANGNSSPKIGDNVTCFPGVLLAGNIIIGSGSMIGANVTLLKDVPPNSTVTSVEPIVRQYQIKQ